jgi:hypothetical protein
MPRRRNSLKVKRTCCSESYNSGGGSGGYNSERRMNSLSGRRNHNIRTESYFPFTLKEQMQAALTEDADSGTWQVYEDEGGNLFLKIKMKKSGEGFVKTFN